MFDFIPARVVLAILSFFGFINLYLIRFGFSVISVAMITPSGQRQPGNNESCGELEICNISDTDKRDFFGVNLTATAKNEDYPENGGTLDWDERTRGLVLGVFSYGYCLTQIIGGRLAERKGAKYIFGPAVTVPALLHFFIPVAAKWSYWGVVVIRLLQGFLQGVSWPSMMAILSCWIPPNERSRFVGTVMFGSTFGMFFILPLSGFLCSAVSWEGACYISGAFPLVWGLFWFSLMYSKPKYHPRITLDERNYIEAAVAKGGTSAIKARSVPWKSVFMSLPFIALVVSALGASYGFVLIAIQMPNFFANMMKFSITKTGFVSGIPFLFRYIGAVFFSFLADKILSRKLLRVSTTRKVFSAIAMLLPAASISILLLYALDNPSLFVGLLCAVMFFNGAIAPSIAVNPSDIAPNYSGTLFGILNTVGSVSSFIYLLIMGEILNEEASLKNWKIVFWLAIPMMVGAEICFLLLMSGSPQPWNFQEDLDDEEVNLQRKAKYSTDCGDSSMSIEDLHGVSKAASRIL